MKPGTGESPSKVFGAMLAYYRMSAGLTPEQLGTKVFLSGSQIRKVEAGTRTPSEDLAKACENLPELGCNGALTALYEVLAEHLKNRAYPGWFAGWPEKEAHARRLRSFELVVIPGLLQTEEYARAVLSTQIGASEEEISDAVAGRIARQRILDRDNPPELWSIIDEGVLRRPVGSPQVMRDQLKHLAEMGRRSRILVQVIPLEAGAHQGLKALLAACCALALRPADFTSRDPRHLLAPQLGKDPEDMTGGQISYDLRRLRAHQIIERIRTAATTRSPPTACPRPCSSPA
jgi:transcriptional regulator with XRE-family HTH domain